MAETESEPPDTSYKAVVSTRVTAHRRAWTAKRDGKTVLTTISTGIPKWDIELGVLTVIGAPTGEGKSVVMMHLAKSGAQQGLKVLVLSFEDPAAKTADRTLAALTGISARRLGKLDYDEGQLEQLEAAETLDMAWAELVEFHDGLVDADEAYNIVEASGARLVLIDYAQAFPDGADGGSRERMLADFALKVNKLAQTHHMAPVLFSQTKAAIAERGRREWGMAKRADGGGSGSVDGFRPGPGNIDLAWSTALGERAKCLVYLFRPGRWARKCGDRAAKDDTMEIIVDKANFAEEGTIVVKWDGARGTIAPMPKDDK
jgi:replicative DNA helicase